MNWLNWHWWRTKGCYRFRTCVRCLRPLLTRQPLCSICEIQTSRHPGTPPTTPHTPTPAMSHQPPVTVDTIHLAGLARAASLGPWKTGGCSGRMLYDAEGYNISDTDLKSNAAFMAAANPAAILALIEELDYYKQQIELIGKRKPLQKLTDQGVFKPR